MKKLIASTVAAIMLAASIPALGAEGISAEEAIAAARTALPIPEELTEFSYDYGDYGYNLEWNDPEYEKTASAAVNMDGVVIAYSFYDGTSHRGLSEYRKSELQQIAKEFLETVIPDLADKLVLSEDSGYRNIVFDRYENGVRVENNHATVYVNTVTGTVQDYYLSWDFDSSFGGENNLTDDEAIAALSDNAVSLIYQTFWNEGESTAFPVYEVSSDIYINAGDGTAFEGSHAFKSQNSSMEAMAEDTSAESSGSGGGGGSYRLTEQELAEVEAMSTLITEEQAAEIVASLTELWLPEEYETEMSYYTIKTEDDTTYNAVMLCEWEEGLARITMDAQSGEIKEIGISREDGYNLPENPVPDEACTAAADSFINKIKDLTEYRLSEESYSNDRSYVRIYEKYIGDIPYPNDRKTVYVSKNSGMVLGYYENVPDAEIITPASLMDKLEAVKLNYGAELVYTYNEDGAPVLAYTLRSNGDFYTVKAEDGTAIDYSGEIVIAEEEKEDETGHWAWPVFDILRENDIYISGNYSLDDEINREDFVYLLRRVANMGSLPYRYTAEIEDNGSEPLTREEAAETIMRNMGWDMLIDLDIFTTKFADEGDFVQGIGGAAILQGLGIMQGDGGYFYPTRNLTYGEAYSIAYNLAVTEVGSGGDDRVEPLHETAQTE